MADTIRALCTELVNKLHDYATANPHHDTDDLVTRARAALSQPEPAGLSDEELWRLFCRFCREDFGNKFMTYDRFSKGARAVEAATLARAADLLAQRYPQPVPVSEWRTIDTAPKDGTEILASDYDAVEILSWRKGRFELGIPGEWISRDGQAFFPAWWQPLAGHPALPLPGEVEG